MPIYMDRHDVSEEVTAENVAQLHQEDLKIQDQYNCKGLTYWFDDVRKTAFCLVEAPNKEALVAMHNNAHGEVPHLVIEVDPTIVESFLGRIEDPEKSKNTQLNIINDPAFRILVVVNTDSELINGMEIDDFNGRLVRQTELQSLFSFTTVSKAIKCAIVIRLQLLNLQKPFTIGIASGVPVTDKSEIFENTVKLAERLSRLHNNKISTTREVIDLFKSENQNNFSYSNEINIVDQSEEHFLTSLMDYTDKFWRDSELKVEDFNTKLGYSKSKFYRLLKSLTGKSPNAFLKDFRLSNAQNALKNTNQTISEIAYNSGFSSPSYFSKCFQKQYGVIPSSCQNQSTRE